MTILELILVVITIWTGFHIILHHTVSTVHPIEQTYIPVCTKTYQW